MDSKAKFAGHSVHPILIVFPLGLLATSFMFDVIYLWSRNPQWAQVSEYMIGAGIVGGVVAAIFGLWDWLAIPANTRAKEVGLWHGVGNAVVLALFAVSWYLRLPAPYLPSGFAIFLSLIGVVIACVTGWLGGELVERLGVGVHDGADLNAPNSLAATPPAGPGPKGTKRAA